MKIEINNDWISTECLKVYSQGGTYINKRDLSHRIDGPTYEHSDGDESWYFKNKLQRKYGPAVKWIGDEWWFEGKEYTQGEFWEKFL